MVKPIIKICGIKDAAMATLAVNAGANYIGILFHPDSPRYVELGEAIKIARATHEAGATPVAVFVNQSASEMHSICETTHITSIQLHGKIARKHHHLLPQDYQRIYALSEEQDNLDSLDQKRDFILIDHANPGQGQSINWTTFRYSLPFRWLLAGGLTSKNIKTAKMLKPNGFDVSSGVESSMGCKDITLIQQFINAVEDCHEK